MRNEPILCAGAGVLLLGSSAWSQLPPVPVPSENPITEEKRVLGKMLFWDEQLSSDNTMACGTCHIPGSGGADPVPARNAFTDGVLGSPDDVFGSFGVNLYDANKDFMPSSAFGFGKQITGRAANSAIMAMYAPELFWDGRAGGEFTDPQSGAVSIVTGGALESQAVGPIVSDVEMAHMDRDWNEISAKLKSAQPLGLAASLPSDVADAIAIRKSYPALFEDAFGDGAITSERIAFAIATYERTLLPDQTPWDLFMAGQPGAMTPGQVAGWNFFQTSNCAVCHQPPLFTDHSFRNIAVQPASADLGREDVTGNPLDRRRFKTPTLRNAGLKANFMHSGTFNSMMAVINHYDGPPPGVPGIDPLYPVPVPPPLRPALNDFLTNALTDPRVANETFPFDRPALASEMPANPAISSAATSGSGGVVPEIIAATPPNVGNADFKIGVFNASGGATAFVAISETPPVAGEVAQDQLIGPISLNGAGVGNGYGTADWPIANDPTLDGKLVYMQWRIDDAGAAGGVALSDIAQVTITCNGDCPPVACVCERTGDMPGQATYVDVADLLDYLAAWFVADPSANLDGGVVMITDLLLYLECYFQGGDCAAF